MTDEFIDWTEVSEWAGSPSGNPLHERKAWVIPTTLRNDFPGVSLLAYVGAAPFHHDMDIRDEINGFPVLLHPEVRIDPLTVVAAGFKRSTQIGRSFIGSQIHIGHDSIIGDDVHIHAGTMVGGFCVIGDGTKIGIGARIRPHRTIGRDSYIGMGSVVTTNVPDGEVWYGSPATFRGKRCEKCHQVEGGKLCRHLHGADSIDG